MPDIFTKEKRSEVMSRIKSKNTLWEREIFSHLRRHKIYFQKHYKKVKGSPDIALPKKKRVIFLDGDFWHGRNFKKLNEKLPKVYWREKIANNIARDKKVRRHLKRNGWTVLRVWEYDFRKKRVETLAKISVFLSEQ